MLLAVDPVEPTVDEAVDLGRRPAGRAPPALPARHLDASTATTAKGRLVNRLLTGGCALHVAHTNADDAVGGVTDALARVLGLVDPVPLVRSRPGRRAPGRPGRRPRRPDRLGAFAQRVADALPPTPVGIRVAGDLPGRSAGSPSSAGRATCSSTYAPVRRRRLRHRRPAPPPRIRGDGARRSGADRRRALRHRVALARRRRPAPSALGWPDRVESTSRPCHRPVDALSRPVRRHRARGHRGEPH